jgi:hypothetical protein
MKFHKYLLIAIYGSILYLIGWNRWRDKGRYEGW